MFDTILDALPPKLRLVALGAGATAVAASLVYGIATFAAVEKVSPVQAELTQHKREQTKREQEYLYPLLEAIWSDQRALCAANQAARCDGYNPVRPASDPR